MYVAPRNELEESCGVATPAPSRLALVEGCTRTLPLRLDGENAARTLGRKVATERGYVLHRT